ncbi:ABC transporter permease, partial [Streptomyces sp. NPDC059802]
MTAHTPRRPADTNGPASLPGARSIGLRRGALELRQFFRRREQVVFT